MRLRHALATAALAAASVAPFVMSAGPAGAQSGSCPGGFSTVSPESGRQLVSVASGVPAGCVNTTCPNGLVPVSPFADGGSPKFLVSLPTPGGPSEAGCFKLTGSLVAPLVLSVGSQTTGGTAPVVVGGVVENRTVAPADVVGGIRPSSVGSSVLARTGAESASRAKEAAALIGGGAVLMLAAAWHLRSSRRQEVAALTLS